MNICGCAVNPYKFDDERPDRHMKKTQAEHAFFLIHTQPAFTGRGFLYVVNGICFRRLLNGGDLNSPTVEQHIRG